MEQFITSNVIVCRVYLSSLGVEDNIQSSLSKSAYQDSIESISVGLQKQLFLSHHR